jgi:hypothetical protein
MRACLALSLVLLAGCGIQQRLVAKPNVPQTVTVTVEKYRPLPDWAKAVLPNLPPIDGTVGAIWHADEARAATLDFANCTRRLLARLDKGETVSSKECSK